MGAFCFGLFTVRPLQGARKRVIMGALLWFGGIYERALPHTHGENAAEAYLVARGAKVRERNFRTRAGEIDLIVELDGCIVFVEVKRRSTPRLGRPAEAVTPAKRRKIIQCAKIYAAMHHLMDARLRFDVVELTPGHVNHIPAAFDTTGMA